MKKYFFTNELLPYIGFGIGLCLFACLSCFFPPSHSLWLDETSSVFFASQPGKMFFDLISNQELNMSLYYVALKLWMGVVGMTSEIEIRLLSVVFFVSIDDYLKSYFLIFIY